MLIAFFLSLWAALGFSPGVDIHRRDSFDMTTRPHPDATNNSGGGVRFDPNINYNGDLRG